MTDWSFGAWPAIEPDWMHVPRLRPDDHVEFHVDIGCGKVKKGRIGVDRGAAPGVNVQMDLDTGWVYSMTAAAGLDAVPVPFPPPWASIAGGQRAYGRGLPFEDSSIESIIAHHCLEHLRDGFMPLMDDMYRVLKPDGLLRIISPLWPSHSAISDQDHKRWFMEDSFDAFCGTPGDTPQNCWLAGFSVPYTRARFTKGDVFATPIEPDRDVWEQGREIRISLRAEK